MENGLWTPEIPTIGRIGRPIFILSVKPASRYELKLIVSLITEWMSGRLYVPWLLEGVNVITDPLAIQYKIKFIGRFVGRNLKFIGNM